MKQHLLFLMGLFLLPFLASGQVVLEDFEGGAKLSWNAIEGSFAVVENPAGGDLLNINTGGQVGAYTKKAGAAYSLFLVELAAPLDLSVNNQFRIMVKAPVATAFIMKLEGPNFGIEQTKNIAVANEWMEYTFNFSAAAAQTNVNKIILFFDPGVDASSDTYLFDNIVAEPSGACSGVARDPAIWEDFECQRNISYGLPGLTDFTVVDNPDLSGLNTSAKVGRYRDTLSEYHAMVMDYGQKIPLEDRSVLKIKLWAPVAGNLLVKLEGGSSPIKEVPVAVSDLNKWVEYSVDFSGQIGATHQKLVLFFNAGELPGANDIYYFDDIKWEKRPDFIVLEDFEGGAKLPWNAIEGSFAVVANPPGGDTLMLNGSSQVGAYTKADGSAFSLFLAELPAPLNLAVFNQFRIQVKSAVPSAFIMKLEGPSGNIERTKTIAVTDEWIEYTFDFSGAADKTDFNKIILFFDPGVGASSDTYLFDNLVAAPAGVCAGTVANPDVLDDFECQRNITYGSPGFLDVQVVDNPDKSAVNDSDQVGKYTDVGSEYHALVLDFGRDIPLADRHIVKIKVWAPVAGTLLVKLEGGSSNPREKPTQITETNKWVEYTIDFSDQIGASHQKLVFFFNAGKLPGDNDVYYIDDIRLTPQENITLEDFEGGPKMFWESLNNNPAVFGSFNGAIANPDKTGANTTETVGSYTKGTSPLGGLTAFLPLDFSPANFPQMNLQVWAPEGAANVALRLNSPIEGLKEITRPVAVTQQWIDLSFNFDNFKTITDFESVEIAFDPGVESNATWYFDNLTQSKPTVDACEGVVPKINIIDDFDCQRNATVTTTGGDFLEVIRNPDPSGINGAANDFVGKYTDPLDEWSAIIWDYGQPIDLSTYNQLSLKIWSPKAVPVLFKLEGGTQLEVPTTITAANTGKWVQYTLDFSGAIGMNNTKLAIFFNAGQLPTENDVYYIDDVEWKRQPYTACISSFETAVENLGKWQYFANADLDGAQVEVVVDNPHKTGINTSEKVAEFIERPGGEIFAGMFTTELPSTVILPNNNKTIRMKVWMDTPGTVVFKLERSTNGAPNTGDTKVNYTTPGEWQELEWDFSGIVPDGAIYTVLTVILNFDNTPAAEKKYYFDDIVIGASSCGTSTSTRAVVIEPLRIYPNPVAGELTIENAAELYGYQVFNLVGQRMLSVQTNGQPNVRVDVSSLQKGIYVLAGYDRNGVLRANARFVKQ